MAGQLLLSHILDSLPAHEVAIIDPDFLGGDLCREYGSIRSNTTIGQKADSLRACHQGLQVVADALEKVGDRDSTICLSDLIQPLRAKAIELARGCQFLQTNVTRLMWKSEEKQWYIYLSDGRTHVSHIVCLATGMKPRHSDCEIPSIPLRIALDSAAVKRIVHPGNKVLVIGSAHSGTLCIRNILDIKKTQVTCLYRGTTPFRYARDGAYDGIKQESAEIADAIQEGKYGSRIQMISTRNTAEVLCAARRANWIVQAIGFDARLPDIIVDSEVIIPEWNPSTGRDSRCPRLTCFGACVPNKSEVEGIHFPDISLGSFVDQIPLRWPLVKEDINVG